MGVNYYENNRKLLEQVLANTIKDIFVRLKMGMADWDIDVILRETIINSSKLDEIKQLIKKYNETFEISIRSNIQLDEKYRVLYKLEK